MFLLAVLVLCIASVPLAGGRLGRLGDIRFRRSAAALAAVLLQFLIMRAFPGGDPGVHQVLHLVSYGLMFYFLAANLMLPGLWLIGLGGGLNALAIAANNGVMPAHPDALALAGLVATPGEFANSALVDGAKLWLLGDIFALPAEWPLANVFSVGDLLLILGALVLLHRQSESRLSRHMGAMAALVRRALPQLELVRDNRPFRRLWLANGISAVGDWVYPVAVFSYVIGEDTGAAGLAFLMMAQFGPGLLVGVFGGPLIDRFSRKAMMLWTDLARGAAVATLLVAGDPGTGHLYAVAIVIGIGGAFNQPAFHASLPNLLPVRSLAGANSLVGLTMGLAITVGPVLGAVIVGQFGISWGFTANAASFFFSAALVYGTRMPRRPAAVRRPFGRELADGARFVAGHRVVLSVVCVVGLITVGAGIKSPLEPLFAIESLGAGPAGLGWMGGMWGLGMLAGALVASRLDARLGHGPLLTTSILTVGVAVALGAYAPSLAPVLVLWVVAGIANTTGTVAYETLLQEQTPDAVRGRVFAAVEAALQAGQVAGVGLAVFAEALFGDEDAARHGLFTAGLLFAAASAISWHLLQRRRPTGPALVVSDIELLRAGPSLALLRVATAQAPGSPPVLVVDDGRRVHRLDALPGHDGRRFGYGVPHSVLRRSALALEVPAARLDLPPLRA